MLATRSWTGYELTQQVRRSLRFVWSLSEGHLYREQRRLVALGWATVSTEPAGRRTRQRYTITSAGRRALRNWLASPPEEPHLQIEGVLRSFYADSSGPGELAAAMRTTAESAHRMKAELFDFVDDYLAEGGPLQMLEGTIPTGDFRGRAMHPRRLHSVALALEITTRLLETIDEFFTQAAAEVSRWPSTTDPSLATTTRQRLERIRARDPRG